MQETSEEKQILATRQGFKNKKNCMQHAIQMFCESELKVRNGSTVSLYDSRLDTSL
jgi:hypothetical protein